MNKKSATYYHDLLTKFADQSISKQELWELERYSLDDPFFFEAMEGLRNQETKEDRRKLRAIWLKENPKIRSWIPYGAVAAVIGAMVMFTTLWINSDDRFVDSGIVVASDDLRSDDRINSPNSTAKENEQPEISDEIVVDLEPSMKRTTQNEIELDKDSEINKQSRDGKDALLSSVEAPIEDMALTVILPEVEEIVVKAQADDVADAHKSIGVIDIKPLDRAEVVPSPSGVSAHADQGISLSDNLSKRGQESFVLDGIRISGVSNVPPISGIVTDENGETLIGAKVTSLSSGIEIFTDLNGRFSLDDSIAITTLDIGYTGYSSLKLDVRADTFLHITLMESAVLSETITSLGVSNEPSILKQEALVLDEVRVSGLNNSRIVEGMITDDNGEALIGATVMSRPSGIGTNTDLNGNFSLTDVTLNPVLEVTYIGYNAARHYVGIDSLSTIALSEGTMLDEVVVVSGRRSRNRRQITETPKSPIAKEYFCFAEDRVTIVSPKKGFLKFDKYVINKTKKAKFTASGYVELAFTILGDGTIADPRVINSDSPECNALAMEILETGGKWKTEPANQEVTMRYVLRIN